jgi:hypothetical protein
MNKPTMRPTVGRVVHYQSYGTPGGEFIPEARAAIITRVEDGTQAVGLCVLNPTGMYFNDPIPYAEEPTPGHWNWPPRVSV